MKLLILLFTLMPISSEARWALREEYPKIYESISKNYTVHKDGTFEEELTQIIRILNASGRTAGSQRFSFNATNTQMEIVSAEISLNGVTKIVPKKYIQLRSVQEQEASIEKKKVWSISFQDVQVGSILKTKVKIKHFKASIKDFFAKKRDLNSLGYVESFEEVVNSEIPLFFEKNDPLDLIEMKEEQAGQRFVYRVKNRKPISLEIQEEKRSYFSPEGITWFGFSSTTNFSEMAKNIIPKLEKKFLFHPSKEIQKVLAEASLIEKPADQINFITNWLNGNFRYLKDYQDADSGLVPRDLSIFLKTRFGDCKDFSLLTSYLLRKLNFQANLAWVHRGIEEGIFPRKIALHFSNHMIVYAEKSGQKFWVDPTNKVSFAHGMFLDIEGRPSLVLDPQNPRMMVTQVVPAEKNIVEHEFNRDFSGIESDSVFEYKFFDSAALEMAGIENQMSLAKLKFLFLIKTLEERNILQSQMQAPDLKSRVVKDIQIQIKVKEKIVPMKTGFGLGFRLPISPKLDQVLDIASKDRVSGLDLGQVSTKRYRFVYRGIKVKGELPKPCEVKTPWIEASREIQYEGRELRVTDTVATRKKYISQTQGPEFKSLQSQISDCFENIVVIYE